MYTIRFDKPAEKFIENADKKLAKRILDRIEELKDNPFPRESLKVKGYQENVYRIRVGKYRILYIVFRNQSLISITEIDKRCRVYK